MAKYVGESQYCSRDLRMNGAQIGSWINNYSLQTGTPNGKRETMAIEFTQQ